MEFRTGGYPQDPGSLPSLVPERGMRPQTCMSLLPQRRNARIVESEGFKFKPHAIKVAEAARHRFMNPDLEPEDAEMDRLKEISQWEYDVIDLHRVLSVSQAVFLVLEQHNEALLRVAVEIATCRLAKKVLWWQDGWYGDEPSREWFRRQVKAKLAQCKIAMNVDLPDESKENMLQHQELTSRAETAEKKCKAMEALQLNTENQVIELKQALEHMRSESTSRAKELEKSLEKMRAELKRHQAQAVGDNKTVETVEKKSLEEAQQRIMLAEEQKKKVEDKLAKVEREYSDLVSKSQSQMSAAQGKVKDLESQVRQLTTRLEMEEQRLRELRNQQNQISAASKPSGHLEQELKSRLAQERSRAEELLREAEDYKARASAYETEIATLKPEIGERDAEICNLKQLLSDERTEIHNLKQELQAAAAAAAAAAERAPAPEPRPVATPTVEKKVKVAVKRDEDSESDSPSPERIRKVGIDEKEHYKVLDQLAQSRERNRRLKESNEELKEQNEEYEKKNMKLLSLLNQLKEQLKRITEIAERKGYGKLVAEIMEESKLNETLANPEFSTFDRLWQDAQRRQERQRLLQEIKMGLRSKDELEEWDLHHGVTIRSNGARRSSYLNLDELPEGRKSMFAARKSMIAGPRKSMFASHGGYGGEISSSDDAANEPRAAATVDLSHLGASISSSPVTSDYPRRQTFRLPEQPQGDLQTTASDADLVSQLPQYLHRDSQAINGPPANSLRRPRTTSFRTPSPRRELSPARGQADGHDLFQIQGQSPFDDGRPRTTLAGLSGSLHSPTQTSLYHLDTNSTKLPMLGGKQLDSPEINTANLPSAGGGNTTVKSPLSSKSAGGSYRLSLSGGLRPMTSTANSSSTVESPASNFQEYMNGRVDRSMQMSASAPNLPSVPSSPLPKNEMLKRSKTLASKLTGYKRLHESNSPSLLRNSRLRPTTSGLRPTTSGLEAMSRLRPTTSGFEALPAALDASGFPPAKAL